ncbi:hypothetical protein BSKO_11950 [Bryopsis sp. KO-2023]|nr:hypothetical protein BSKO_11950 [Bryopsis sp. KO-2023]
MEEKEADEQGCGAPPTCSSEGEFVETWSKAKRRGPATEGTELRALADEGHRQMLRSATQIVTEAGGGEESRIGHAITPVFDHQDILGQEIGNVWVELAVTAGPHKPFPLEEEVRLFSVETHEIRSESRLCE